MVRLPANEGDGLNVAGFKHRTYKKRSGQKTQLYVAAERQDDEMCLLLIDAGLDRSEETWLTSSKVPLEFDGNPLLRNCWILLAPHHLISSPISSSINHAQHWTPY